MTDRVLLSVPARGEYARTVRLAAASLATRAGMTFEGVEDVRMAAEEAFVLVSDRASDDTQVDIAFARGGARCLGPSPNTLGSWSGTRS